QGLRQRVEPFGRQRLEGLGPGGGAQGGGGLAPVPAVVTILTRPHHELQAPVLGLTDVDEHARREGIFVPGHGLRGSVETRIGEVELPYNPPSAATCRGRGSATLSQRGPGTGREPPRSLRSGPALAMMCGTKPPAPRRWGAIEPLEVSISHGLEESCEESSGAFGARRTPRERQADPSSRDPRQGSCRRQRRQQR